MILCLIKFRNLDFDENVIFIHLPIIVFWEHYDLMLHVLCIVHKGVSKVTNISQKEDIQIKFIRQCHADKDFLLLILNRNTKTNINFN